MLGPCSFDMAHHLAHSLFWRLNGQINHVTDCSREMNGCSIIRLRPNLSAICEQQPGAPQPARRLSVTTSDRIVSVALANSTGVTLGMHLSTSKVITEMYL